MKIFISYPSNGSQCLNLVRSEDLDYVLRNFDGHPMFAQWKPLHVKILKRDLGKPLKFSDSPSMGASATVLSDAAMKVLSPVMQQCGEILPLKCDETSFHVLNVTRVVDVLDEPQSEAWRFATGRIMRIVKHAFHQGKLAEETFFKIPNLKSSPVYYTERVVDLWRGAKLRGLDFTQVWPQ